MAASSFSTVLPVEDLPAAVDYFRALLGVEPTFVDGDNWAQFDVGPRRIALVRRMTDVTQAYMPLMLHTFGVGNVLYYPWLEGYWPSAFGFSWKWVDIDIARRKAALGRG